MTARGRLGRPRGGFLSRGEPLNLKSHMLLREWRAGMGLANRSVRGGLRCSHGATLLTTGLELCWQPIGERIWRKTVKG